MGFENAQKVHNAVSSAALHQPTFFSQWVS